MNYGRCIMNEEDKCLCFPAKNSKLIINDPDFELVQGKHPTLIVGFLGVGLIGNIVTTEIIDSLKMKPIGFIATRDISPIAVFYDGVLKHPFQLYYSKEKNIVIARCEVPFNKSENYWDLARLISDWALHNGIEELACIQGLGTEGLPEKYPVYVAAETEVLERIKNKSGAEVLPKGIVMGPEASLLNVALNNKINAYILLTPANSQIPSPQASAEIIEKLNKLYDLGVDTSKLLEDEKIIKEKLLELNSKTQQQHSQLNLGPPSDNSSKYYL
jgi:uncharacterized protein